MTPRLSVHNLADNAPRYTELAADGRLADSTLSPTCTNCKNILIGQLRHSVRFSGVHTVLRCRIGHVFSMGTNEQMIQSNARRIVAVVARTQTLRYRPVDQFPGESMRLDSLARRLFGADDFKCPVTVLVGGTCPQPTPIRDTYSRPESICGWFGHIYVFGHSPARMRELARTRTEPGRGRVRGLGHHRLAACFADHSDWHQHHLSGTGDALKPLTRPTAAKYVKTFVSTARAVAEQEGVNHA